MQTVMDGLLKTRGSPADVYVWTPESDASGVLKRCLASLEERRLAHCESELGTARFLRMTLLGGKLLRSSNTLVNPRRVFTPPSKPTKDEDCDVIQLHARLRDRGWSCEVIDPKRRPAHYVVGDPKIWWLRHSAELFDAYYFRALLSAGRHCQPVRHKGTQEYYLAIMAGKAAPPRKSRDKDFDMNAAVHTDLLPKPVRKPR
jgi:hypothetical protein